MFKALVLIVVFPANTVAVLKKGRHLRRRRQVLRYKSLEQFAVRIICMCIFRLLSLPQCRVSLRETGSAGNNVPVAWPLSNATFSPLAEATRLHRTNARGNVSDVATAAHAYFAAACDLRREDGKAMP